MSDIPEHIWEAARSLRNAVCWQSNSSIEPIAAALLAAEQRGREMERAECARHVENIGAEIEVHALNLNEQMLGKSIASAGASLRSRSEGKGGE